MADRSAPPAPASSGDRCPYALRSSEAGEARPRSLVDTTRWSLNWLDYVPYPRAYVAERREEGGDHIWGAGAYGNTVLYHLVRRRAKIEVVPGDSRPLPELRASAIGLSEVLRL